MSFRPQVSLCSLIAGNGVFNMGKRGPEKKGLNSLSCVKKILAAQRKSRFVKKHKERLHDAKSRLSSTKCGESGYRAAVSDLVQASHHLRRRSGVCRNSVPPTISTSPAAALVYLKMHMHQNQPFTVFVLICRQLETTLLRAPFMKVFPETGTTKRSR